MNGNSRMRSIKKPLPLSSTSKSSAELSLFWSGKSGFFSSYAVRKLVGFPNWLGKAIAFAGGQNQTDCRLNGDLIAGRDKDGLHVRAGAHYRPNPFSFEPKPAIRAASSADRAVFAHQSGLGATYGRETNQQPRVGCEPEASGMGDSLTVEEDHVGALFQQREGLEQNGRLAKREQPGNVGELNPPLDPALFHNHKFRKAQHDDGAEDRIVAGRISDIGAGYPANVAEDKSILE